MANVMTEVDEDRHDASGEEDRVWRLLAGVVSLAFAVGESDWLDGIKCVREEN